jgi:hypothetical protein
MVSQSTTHPGGRRKARRPSPLPGAVLSRRRAGLLI